MRKQSVGFAALAVLWLSQGAWAAAGPGGIHWLKSATQAGKEAQQTSKVLLVDFYADW